MKADIVIVGAGMAGASLAAELAPYRTVILIEAESQPGYHSTGRSAAFWSETYGGPLVQPLSTASGPFLRDPPASFSDAGFLRPRGALHLACGRGPLEAMASAFAGTAVELDWMGLAELERVIPTLAKGWDSGLWEPSCADIDVAALHRAYLSSARRAGVTLLPNAPLQSAERGARAWAIRTGVGEIEASILVNAAGAWADQVATSTGQMPLGIRPYRRTMAQVRVEPSVPADLPLVVDALGRFYFKPEAGGRLWLSPHDETACEPCDSAPEEMDVALAIDRLEQVTGWKVIQIEHKWAGLRSFAPDRLPVYGWADDRRDFFWFAGQGGVGIQTAPAAAKLAAALLLEQAPDPMVAAIDPVPYLPARFGMN